MFSNDSRYKNIPVDTVLLEDGSTLASLRRRFLPPLPETEGTMFSPEQGDRIDQIAAKTLGDPLQFWRIADVNRELNPFDLVIEVGRPFRLPGVGDF